MNHDNISIAVAGAGDLVGEEILRLLGTLGLERGRIHALASGAAVGQPAECGETWLTIEDGMCFDYAQVQVVLSALAAADAASCLPPALAAGCVVVDASGAVAEKVKLTAPLVLVELNPDALEVAASTLLHGAAAPGGSLVTTPGYAASQALRVLSPLQREFGLKRVALTACHPAARGGRGGIESLARQSISALGGSGVHAAGAAQAFAVVPLLAGEDGSPAPGLEAELRLLLGRDKLDVRVAELQVPVFYDCSLALELDLEYKAGVPRIKAVLDAVPGLRETRAGEPRSAGGSGPRQRDELPQDDAQPDVLQLLWLRSNQPGEGQGLSLGLRGDAVRCGVAANQLRILQRILAESALD